MSDTTKTPRAHADLAIKFYSDSKMKCWYWSEKSQTWVVVGKPGWEACEIYEVSEYRPPHKPKKRVTIAGITFDAPETEAPKVGMKYWLIDIDRANSMVWSGSPVEQRWLAAGLAHLDYENARLHTQALIKLNRQLCGMGELLRKEDSND